MYAFEQKNMLMSQLLCMFLPCVWTEYNCVYYATYIYIVKSVVYINKSLLCVYVIIL